MKLHLLTTCTCSSTLWLPLLLLSFAAVNVSVVDAQGGPPAWAQNNNKNKDKTNTKTKTNNGNGGGGNGGQGQGQGQGRPNGAAGGLGGGGGGLFGNKNIKNKGNKFGFKLLGPELIKLDCQSLLEKNDQLLPENNADLPRREANRQRRDVRTLICAKDCVVQDIFDSDTGELMFECEDEGQAKDLCKMTNQQMKRAKKKATQFGRKAQNTNGKFPDHVQARFQTKFDRLQTMQGQLEGQLKLLNENNLCGVASPGN